MAGSKNLQITDIVYTYIHRVGSSYGERLAPVGFMSDEIQGREKRSLFFSLSLSSNPGLIFLCIKPPTARKN